MTRERRPARRPEEDRQPMMREARFAYAIRRPHIAAIEGGRLHQGRAGSVRSEPLERGDVHLHILSGKPHALALADEPFGAERRPQREQGLPKAVPGLVIGGVAPEERGQLISRVGLARGQREVGEQGLSYLERQGYRPRSEGCAEFPEQGEGETRHQH